MQLRRHIIVISSSFQKFKMAELLLSLLLSFSLSLSLPLLERVGCEIILLLNPLVSRVATAAAAAATSL